jgi:hypothetical protein
LALEQNLKSGACFVPALEQVPGGHATLMHLPPAQLPLPFMMSAKAAVLEIGAVTDKPTMASAIQAAANAHLMS